MTSLYSIVTTLNIVIVTSLQHYFSDIINYYCDIKHCFSDILHLLNEFLQLCAPPQALVRLSLHNSIYANAQEKSSQIREQQSKISLLEGEVVGLKEDLRLSQNAYRDLAWELEQRETPQTPTERYKEEKPIMATRRETTSLDIDVQARPQQRSTITVDVEPEESHKSTLDIMFPGREVTTLTVPSAGSRPLPIEVTIDDSNKDGEYEVERIRTGRKARRVPVWKY